MHAFQAQPELTQLLLVLFVSHVGLVPTHALLVQLQPPPACAHVFALTQVLHAVGVPVQAGFQVHPEFAQVAEV